MSRVSTSGFNCGMRCNAIRPFAATPTTSSNGSSSSACATRRRMTTESSTTSTRILSPGRSNRLFTLAIPYPSRMDSHKLELLNQDVFSEGLHDVLVSARLQRRCHLAKFGLGGDHDHHQRGKLRHLAQPL